ncbi:MAG: DUF2267 domain-containing protein [Gammaproteobacteria bacterium]
MQTHEFYGRVQDKARLSDLDSSIRATRAALATLAERIGVDASLHLGAELPGEIARHLREATVGTHVRFDAHDFLARVSAREGEDLPVATQHACAVLATLDEAVSAGEMARVRARLPDDYAQLFARAQGHQPSA